TRSTRAAGTKLRSADGTDGSPGIRRRLSISTRVREEPRPRRSTVAVPVAPLEGIEPWPANTCGSELVMSSIRVTPWALMSALPTVVTGAIEVRFGEGMRVPVTTISETSPAAASAAAAAAAAWVADRPRKAAPQIIEEASRRSRVVWIFKVYSSSGRLGERACPQTKSFPESQSSPVTAELRAYRTHGQRTLAFGNVAGRDLSHSGHRSDAPRPVRAGLAADMEASADPPRTGIERLRARRGRSSMRLLKRRFQG